MAGVSRRHLLAGGLGVGAAAALGGCDALRVSPDDGEAGPAPGEVPIGDATTSADNDGSWRDTGKQPNQPDAPRAAGSRGQEPPQFVDSSPGTASVRPVGNGLSSPAS